MAVAMATASTATAALVQLGSRPLLAPSRNNFFVGSQSVTISNARRCVTFPKRLQSLTVHAKTSIGKIEDSDTVSTPFNSIPVLSLYKLRIQQIGRVMQRQCPEDGCGWGFR